MSKKAFVAGHPITHSVSPVIHTYWLKQLGIAGSYEKLDITPDAFPAFLDRVRSGEFVGGNITLPHKVAAFAACDFTSTEATAIGAVNTIVASGGRIEGINTDIVGFLASLDAEHPSWDTLAQEAVVLGSGGAARAIVKGLIDRGFAKIHIVNRTIDHARTLQGKYGDRATAAGMDRLAERSENADILVNATKIGLGAAGFDIPVLEALPRKALVYDIVYGSTDTLLLREAKRKGFATVDGISMVMHQAVEGFSRWFGPRPTVDDNLRKRILAHHRSVEIAI